MLEFVLVSTLSEMNWMVLNIHLVEVVVIQLEVAREQDSTVTQGHLASSPTKLRNPCPCHVSNLPAIWGREKATIYKL